MSFKRTLLATAKKLLVSYCILLTAFTCLIVASFCISASATSNNVIDSIAYIESESNSRVPEDAWTASSCNTEIIMLTMISHGGDDPLRDSMEAGWFRSPTQFSNSVSEGIGQPANDKYERYWNGWMVVLRPLFTALDYGDVKRLLWAVFYILLISLSVLMSKRINKGVWYAGALGISLVLLSPNCIDRIAYAFPTLITLASCIFILLSFKEYKSSNNRVTLYLSFFIIGGITQYFDFLTFPALTLLYPLIICLLIMHGAHPAHTRSFISAKDVIMILVFSSLCWCFGYGLLWASKWVVGSIILGRDIVSESFNQFLFRTGVSDTGFGVSAPIDDWNGRDISPYSSIVLQLKALCPGIKPWMLSVCFALAIVALIAIRKRRDSFIIAIAILVVSLMPYIWFAAASNHSIIHFYFTYRLQAATIFGGLVFLVHCLNEIANCHFQAENKVRHNR